MKMDMPQPKPEDEFVARAKAGDEKAMVFLIHSNSKWLLAYIEQQLPKEFSSLLSPEDIMQEVSTKAYQRIQTVTADNHCGFSAWLRTIAENTILNHRRALKTKKRGGEEKTVRGDDQVAIVKDSKLTPHGATVRKETIVAVKANIEALPTPQRQALTLASIEGRTYEQTAKLMGRTVSAVRGLVQRAKLSLKTSLGSSSKWFYKK